MPVPPLADTGALEIRLGVTFSTPETLRAEAILDDVSGIARKHAGKTWVTDGVLDDDVPADVVAVVLKAARRLFVNPDEFASEQDGDYSYRLPADVISSGTFTEAEIDLLRSYRGTSGLWSQKICGSDDLYGNEFERRWLESFQ